MNGGVGFPTVAVNLLHSPYDVYIGRQGYGKLAHRDGYFGNPYKIGVDGTREEVLSKYKDYFVNRTRTDREFYESIMDLKGKRLGCFCKPEACHGDIIAKYIDFE